MMIIKNKYNLGQFVFLVTDEDQKQRIVTMLKIYPEGGIMYQLSVGKDFSDHYEIEISEEENIEIKTK